MTLGDRIKKLRTRRGWSTRDLAKLARVDYSWINRLETGDRHNISLEAASRLALTLGVSLDYLAGLTRQETPQPAMVSEEGASYGCNATL